MTATPEIVMAPRARLGLLYHDLLRPLTERERGRLRDAIRRDGVLYPLIVDESWGIIDGGHRYQIAEEEGILALPVIVRRGLAPKAKQELARSLNLDRRHLTVEEQQAARKARVVRVAERRREGQSLRQIAEVEGIDPKQVRLDLQKAGGEWSPPDPAPAEAGAPPGAPAKVKGRDGKSYPATRKKAPPAGANGEAQARTNGPPPAPEPLYDALGREVPARQRPAFEALEKFAEAESLVRRALRLVSDLAKDPGGEELRSRCQIRTAKAGQTFRLERLHHALYDLKHARPYSGACPHCHPRIPGPDCAACKGRGWVTRTRWEAAGEDLRGAAELSRAKRPGPEAPQEEGDEE
jgi:ParB-like chromosome segregation protein Spo0J